MTPDELAAYARDIAKFHQEDVDRLYQLLLRLQEAHIEPDPTTIRHEYRLIASEDGLAPSEDDPCLVWLLDLYTADIHTSLYTNFLDVLEEAKIDITEAGTNTDIGSEHGQHGHFVAPHRQASIPERPATPDTFDENDPRWREAIVLDNRKLASQALDAWRDGVRRKREALLDHEDPALNDFADDFYRQNLARKAITHWRNTIKEMQELERVAINHRAKRDAASTLRSWTLAAREGLLRRIRDERLLHKTLGSWQEKTAGLKNMETKADEQYGKQVSEQVLVKLFTRSGQLQEDEFQANLNYKQNLSRRVLRIWFGRMQHAQTLEAKRQSLMAIFAGRHALRSWYNRSRQQVDEKQALVAREQMLKVKFFRKWQAYVKKSKDAKYTAAYQKMRRKVKTGIARAVLVNWRRQIAEIRRMRAEADDFRARKNIESEQRLALNAIMIMYHKTAQFQESAHKAQKFRNEKVVANLEIFGASWLLPTRQILINQRTADDYHSIKTAGYALSKLRSWRNITYRTKRLEDDADRLTQRNERKRTINFLHKWRQGAFKAGVETDRKEEKLLLPPVTPAARRSQLLASTTPAYTPASGLFRKTRALHGFREEDED